jgi:hypothetical protein
VIEGMMKKLSMVALVVEGAVCDDDVGRMRVPLGLLASSRLLRTDHYQGQLTR